MSTKTRYAYYIVVPMERSKRELKLPPFLRVDKFFFFVDEDDPQVKR
jgi:hypothetical protein